MQCSMPKCACLAKIGAICYMNKIDLDTECVVTGAGKTGQHGVNHSLCDPFIKL